MNYVKLVIMCTTNVDGQRFSINYKLEGIYPKRIIKVTINRRLLSNAKRKEKKRKSPHAPGRKKID